MQAGVIVELEDANGMTHLDDKSTVQVDLHRASCPRGDTAAKEVLVLRPNGALQLQAKR